MKSSLFNLQQHQTFRKEARIDFVFYRREGGIAAFLIPYLISSFVFTSVYRMGGQEVEELRISSGSRVVGKGESKIAILCTLTWEWVPCHKT